MLAWPHEVSPAVLAQELECIVRFDCRALLPHLEMPVLARVGALDLPTPPSFSELIASSCPRGTLQVVPACGHAILVEDPSGTTAAVATHLQTSR